MIHLQWDCIGRENVWEKGAVMVRIIDIQGIGSTYQEKLIAVGVHSTSRLLQVGATRRGRKDLSENTGISEKLILEWVNLADLVRIKGIGEEYSDLLEEAGVDTIRELRNRDPNHLHRTLSDINERKQLVRRLPSLRQVANWVQQAKAITPIVKY
jgi:predicted flap endonuclease-1-like 5' DNA nuclease